MWVVSFFREKHANIICAVFRGEVGFFGFIKSRRNYQGNDYIIFFSYKHVHHGRLLWRNILIIIFGPQSWNTLPCRRTSIDRVRLKCLVCPRSQMCGNPTKRKNGHAEIWTRGHVGTRALRARDLAYSHKGEQPSCKFNGNRPVGEGTLERKILGDTPTD